MDEHLIDHSDFVVDEDDEGNLYFPDSEQSAIIEEYFDEESPDRNLIRIRVNHKSEGIGYFGLDMDFETPTFWKEE